MSHSAISPQREQKLLHTVFFLFGFSIMAWVPRFPEVKAQLGLNNGAFGSLISTGSIGAFLGLLTVGHIIHRFGAKRVTVTAILILLTSLAAVVHTHSSLLFLIFNITFGFGITAVHVSINSQAFHCLERSGTNLITSAAGYWSFGALASAILSGFLVGHISLVAQIDAICIVAATLMIGIILSLHPVLLTANKDKTQDIGIKEIFTSFHIDWPVSLGMACAIYLEFAVGDWGTIFTKDRLAISSGLSAAPYIVFTAAMIYGRLVIVQRVMQRGALYIWVRRAALFAGIGFGSSIIIATHLPASCKWWSYGLFLLGFTLGGLGSSFLGPTFFAAANRRSTQPSAVVVGQFGAVNSVLTFCLKWIVAWTIQFTGSIALAMMIPSALLVTTVFFVNAIQEDRKAKK
jgi:nitrate/nitrite transporter NarK